MLRVFMPYHTAPQAAAQTPGRWVAEQAWPPPRMKPYVYYLDAGRLSSRVGSRDHVAFAAKRIVGLTKPEWLSDPPGDQTADDRKSLTFDSAPLKADMEILGYPIVRVKVSADVPVATLVVRLTEVLPDGTSWLVSYALRNLTHRASHEYPAPLTPGEFYDVEVPLFMVAHVQKRQPDPRRRFGEPLATRLAFSGAGDPHHRSGSIVTGASRSVAGSERGAMDDSRHPQPAGGGCGAIRCPGAGCRRAHHRPTSGSDCRDHGGGPEFLRLAGCTITQLEERRDRLHRAHGIRTDLDGAGVPAEGVAPRDQGRRADLRA